MSTYSSTATTAETASCASPVSINEFKVYASKLGYPDNLINRVVEDIGTDASKEDLLERLISLQDMLCPKDGTLRRRRDATHLPSYMLVQDCYYKGKERMPFWVWVKRETISSMYGIFSLLHFPWQAHHGYWTLTLIQSIDN